MGPCVGLGFKKLESDVFLGNRLAAIKCLYHCDAQISENFNVDEEVERGVGIIQFCSKSGVLYGGFRSTPRKLQKCSHTSDIDY